MVKFPACRSYQWHGVTYFYCQSVVQIDFHLSQILYVLLSPLVNIGQAGDYRDLDALQLISMCTYLLNLQKSYYLLLNDDNNKVYIDDIVLS